jgi:hypothetical protein
MVLQKSGACDLHCTGGLSNPGDVHWRVAVHTGRQQCGGGRDETDTTYSAAAASTITVGVLNSLGSP